MGTLGGHLLPGGFFIMFGIWWSFITSIRYIQSSNDVKTKRKNGYIGYKSTVTMPCICLPCSKLRSLPIESILKGVFAFIGLLTEIITGYHTYKYPRPEDINNFVNRFEANTEMPKVEMPMNHEHVHKRDAHSIDQFIPQIYVMKWYFERVNAQHVTMYSAFILGAIVEILKHYKFDLPNKLDHVCGLMAYGIEAFLFAFHLHSREVLDIYLHTFLIYAVYGCIIFTALEIYDENQILFTYGRILFTILQGTWFWQVGFVLYPPTDTKSLQWDHNDHNQVMTITMTFCWHIMLIFIGLLFQLFIMKCIYNSSVTVANEWDELIIIDRFNFHPASNECYNLLHNKNDNCKIMKTTKFMNNLESDDEKVELDMRKRDEKSFDLKNKNKFAINEPNSSSSATSGNFSIEMK